MFFWFLEIMLFIRLTNQAKLANSVESEQQQARKFIFSAENIVALRIFYKNP